MTARSCGRLIAFCLALLGLAPSFSLAAEPVRFEKRQLTDRYYCDGIAAGDINSDGKLDVVAGPFWYEGPDFRDAHEFYPAEPLPPEPSPSNSMFSFVRDFSGDGRSDILVLGRVHKHQAFWYSDADGFELLGFFDPVAQDISGANGISGDGYVIVGYSGEGEYLPDDAVENNSSVTAGPPQDAVAWYADERLGFLRLSDLIATYDPNVLDWDLREAKAVSADGSTIVGWGFNPDGFQEAWVWSLPYAVPEPSQSLMLVTGIVFLVAAARRRLAG